MDYVRVCDVSEMEGEKVRSVSIFGRKIAILDKDDGDFKAVEASCKHQGADLTTGDITDWVATCPRHGWQYDLQTGQCLNHDSLPLKRYDVIVEDGQVKVSFQPIENDE